MSARFLQRDINLICNYPHYIYYNKFFPCGSLCSQEPANILALALHPEKEMPDHFVPLLKPVAEYQYDNLQRCDARLMCLLAGSSDVGNIRCKFCNYTYHKACIATINGSPDSCGCKSIVDGMERFVLVLMPVLPIPYLFDPSKNVYKFKCNFILGTLIID